MTNMFYAVGDIHGCYDKLIKLYNQIKTNYEAFKDEYTATIVFVGDYIDRGPNSKQVIDFLRGNDSVNKLDERFKHVFLMGNHEDMCISFYEHSTFENGQHWLGNGGYATLKSFGENLKALDIPSDYIEWMKGLQLWYNDPDLKYFFVHAGLLDKPVQEQLENKRTMLWIRGPFLVSNYDWGQRIIHGHTPVKSPQIRFNRINIDTGAVYNMSDDPWDDYGNLTAVRLIPDKEPAFIQVR